MKKTTRSKRIGAMLLAAAMILTSISGSFTAFASDSWPNDKAAAEPSFAGYRVKDIKNWSPETDPYAEFLRAEVPLQDRNEAFKATQAKPYLNSDAEVMLMQGDYGNSFFNSTMYTDKFGEHVLNFWQYADYFSPWHGAATAYTPEAIYDPITSDWRQRGFEFGIVNIPNPAYTNAAHKNGVMSIACIYFDPAFRPGQTCADLVEKDENGEFSIADKLIEIARYMGFDGYFLNQEEGYMEEFKPFMAKLTEAGLYTQWYDTNSYFNSSKAEWLKDSTNGQINNSVFVNYGWTGGVDSSLSYAEQIGVDPFESIFFGAECNQNKFSGGHSSAKNITAMYDETGNPRASVALFTPSDWYQRGVDEVPFYDGKSTPPMQRDEFQWMVAERERMFFSGVKEDPTDTGLKPGYSRPDVKVDNASGWVGVADFIAERSVIDGTKFYTNFNTGHGMQYFVDGKVSADKAWTNINIQDILPTWQWWVESTNDKKLEVDFDYGNKLTNHDVNNNPITLPYTQVGAYEGGSSLVVYGDITGSNSLHLYKTDLAVNENSKASVTFKKTSDDAVAMQLGLIFKDAPETTEKLDITGSETAGDWTTAEVDLSKYAGRNIAAITLEFAGEAEGYQMNVGGLKISDGADKPAAPTGFAVDYAYDSGEMILSWDKADYSEVKQYNVYGNLSDGSRVYLGGVYDSILYVKSVFDENESIGLELRAVGADGTESDPATLTYTYNDKVSNVKVEEAETANGLLVRAATPGQLDVSFDAPEAGAPDSYEYEVTLRNIAKADPDNQVYTYTTGGDVTSAAIPLPVEEGYEYDLKIYSVRGGEKGQPICYRGWSNDSYSEPIAEEDIRVNGTTVRLVDPDSVDWYKLYAEFNNNETFEFKRGASSGNSMKRILHGNTGVLSVVTEDFAGNRSEPTVVMIENGQVVDPTNLISEEHFPDAALLKAVKEQVGLTLDTLEKFTKTLDLSGTEVSDLTGLDRLTAMTGVNFSNCTALTNISGLDKCAALKEVNISGCTALETVDLAGLGLEKLDASGEYTAIKSVDISDNKLDLSEGTSERAFVDAALAAAATAEDVKFDNQHPVVYSGVHFLPAEAINMEVSAEGTVDVMSYVEKAYTVRGNEYAGLKDQLINGKSFLAEDVDVNAKPDETFTVSVADQNFKPVEGTVLSLAEDITYTVTYKNAQNETVGTLTIIVGDGGEATTPVDITKNPTILYATEKSDHNSKEDPEFAFDKDEGTKWCPGGNAVQSQMVIDVGAYYTLTEWNMSHAGVSISDGVGRNTRDFALQVLNVENPTAEQLADESFLTNDANWTTVASYENNQETRTHYEFTESVTGRYFRLNVTKGDTSAQWPSTRIYEWSMMGTLAKDPEPTPVDKTELAAAIEGAAQYQEADYTAESWAVFADALAKANEVNADAEATQADVDAAVKALKAAIAGLEDYVPPVDKTELEAAIADAAQYDEANYTKASWAVFADALAKANEVNDNAEATQDEVNAAVEALKAAIAGLEEYAAPDKSLLQATYEYALKQSTEGVTDSAKKFFEDAVAAAKAVLDDPKATQEEVNTAWDNLLEGIWGLGITQGDKTMLEQLIAKAEDMAANESKYVKDNWQQLLDALEAAKAVMNDGDALDEDIQPVSEALLDAILAQRFKADKSNLEDLINKAESIDLSKYTEESVAVFRAAFKAANAVLADESLSEDDQAVVDKAVSELNAAIENLSAKDDATDPDDGKDDTSKPDNGKGDTSSNAGQNNAPTTGDQTPVTTIVIVAVCAAVLLVLCIVLMKKRRMHN